jgi:hypothetical protein
LRKTCTTFEAVIGKILKNKEWVSELIHHMVYYFIDAEQIWDFCPRNGLW